MTREHIKRIAAFILTSTFVVACSSDQSIDSGENTDTAQSAVIDTMAGFEFKDGNLAPASDINFDWNSFSPLTWGTSPAPNRKSSRSSKGWSFVGVEDAQISNSDSGFAGGIKQNDQCAGVVNSKASNKDDLKRIYIASKTVGADVQLALGWVRIPQNTTGSSAHVAFEFNKSLTQCPGTTSKGLVLRSSGDMLIVYDFEGGSSVPSIKLSRWLVSADPGTCETGSKPCWGTAKDLTALLDSNGNPIAEAKVSTATVADTIGPLSSSDNLGVAEFGEAGINLTAAGVFQAGVCDSFGKAFGVTRTSGASATAQMKDLVGPADVHISNCGSLTVVKETDPNPDTTGSKFSFTPSTNLPGGDFSLGNGESKQYDNVFFGQYTITENPSSQFSLAAVDCQGATTTNVDLGLGKATVDLAAGQNVVCTFKNKLKTGSITIKKVTNPSPNLTSSFTFTPSTNLPPGTFSLKNAESKVYSNVLPGSYTILEQDHPDFVLSDISCDNPNATGNMSTKTASIALEAGQNITCTFTNTQKGSITIKKVTNPSTNLTSSFSFTPSSNLPSGTFSLKNTESKVYSNVLPGSYTILEQDHPDFVLSGISCDSPNATGSMTTKTATINLAPGQNVTCTFTNTQKGSITIEKVTDPSTDPTGSTFTFTPSANLSQLDFDLKNAQSKVYTSVPPGTYTVLEKDHPLFTLFAITCDSANASGNATTKTATINLAPGENITCTFTNKQKMAAIKINKTSTEDNAALANATFQIKKGSTLVATVTTNANGVACAENLPFGDYTVQETGAPSGYRIDDTTARTVTVNAIATCSSGAPGVLSFADTPLSKITVSFESLAPGNPTSATIECTGDMSVSQENLPEASPKVLDTIPPGSYTCKVVVK